MQERKRRTLGRIGLLALLSVSAGCATTPSPVPVEGNEPDLAALEGRWTGQYESSESGRSGSITFELTAGRDTAYGDVIMVPGDMAPPVRDADAAGPPAQPVSPVPLSISFVRASEGGISGALTPYTDPACGCSLRTVFEGRIEGDTIRGNYRSTHSTTGQVQRGTWVVARTPE